MRKVRTVLCPHCGSEIKPLPEPQGADASARERLVTVADDFSNESSDDKTANDFAAVVRRHPRCG